MKRKRKGKKAHEAAEENCIHGREVRNSKKMQKQKRIYTDKYPAVFKKKETN